VFEILDATPIRRYLKRLLLNVKWAGLDDDDENEILAESKKCYPFWKRITLITSGSHADHTHVIRLCSACDPHEIRM